MNTSRTAKPLASQQGVMLIEALVGVVLFSLRLLALIGLQAVAIRESTEGKLRSDASDVADRVLGDMASTIDISNLANLKAVEGTYDATHNPAHNWSKAVSDTLSGLPGGKIEITVPLNSPSATVKVTWVSPGGATRTFQQTAIIVD